MIEPASILVIGTGSIGERHARCLMKSGRARVGIVEPLEPRRDKIRTTYTIPHAYASVDQALADREWSAAVICTPAPTHVPIAKTFAARGINLMIEKPLSTSLAGVDELAELVRAKGLVANVAYVYRAHPSLTAMRQAILDGRFGRPLEIIAVTGQHFPFHRPAYREIYYRDRAQGGGAIQDGITHFFNATEWLVGPITRICVDAAHLALAGVEVEDTVHALTRHGPVLGSFAMNQHQMHNEHLITVMCERGTVRYEMITHSWRWLTKPDGAWEVETAEITDRDSWFLCQTHAFLDALEGKKPPLCSLEEGIQTLRVNLAALKSADNGATWINTKDM